MGLNGSNMASQGIVVVTVQHRVGVLGFLPPAGLHVADPNFALRDILLALRSVKDNIVGAGGNPNAVTLGGQSAGALNAQAMLGVPEAVGLFQRLILQSGPLNVGTQTPAQTAFLQKEFYDELLGCKDAKCALRKSAAELMGPTGMLATMSGIEGIPWSTVLRPQSGSRTLPEDPSVLMMTNPSRLVVKPAQVLITTTLNEAGAIVSIFAASSQSPPVERRSLEARDKCDRNNKRDKCDKDQKRDKEDKGNNGNGPKTKTTTKRKGTTTPTPKPTFTPTPTSTPTSTLTSTQPPNTSYSAWEIYADEVKALDVEMRALCDEVYHAPESERPAYQPRWQELYDKYWATRAHYGLRTEIRPNIDEVNTMELMCIRGRAVAQYLGTPYLWPRGFETRDKCDGGSKRDKRGKCDKDEKRDKDDKGNNGNGPKTKTTKGTGTTTPTPEPTPTSTPTSTLTSTQPPNPSYSAFQKYWDEVMALGAEMRILCNEVYRAPESERPAYRPRWQELYDKYWAMRDNYYGVDVEMELSPLITAYNTMEDMCIRYRPWGEIWGAPYLWPRGLQERDRSHERRDVTSTPVTEAYAGLVHLQLGARAEAVLAQYPLGSDFMASLERVSTDGGFRCPSRALAERFATFAQTYVGEFTRGTTHHNVAQFLYCNDHVCHMNDVYSWWGTAPGGPDAFSQEVMGRVADFVKSGTPGSGWSTYDGSNVFAIGGGETIQCPAGFWGGQVPFDFQLYSQ